MDEDILNDNGMEEEYIRKSFIVPNAAIKVACFKAGMTEEDYYNTLGGRMYGDNKEKNEEYKRELCRKIFRPTPEEEEEDINRWKEDGAKVMSFEDCVTLVLEGLPVKTKKDDAIEKEMTLGERFENFLSFVVRYDFSKKKKKTYKPTEVAKIYRENGMTEEMLYKRCIGLGCTEEESKMLVQKCFHPTEEDLKLERS